MATVIGYQPLDMSGNVPGSGIVTVATDTLISVDDGWDRIDYVGSGFAFDGFGNLVSGTLNGINSYTSAGAVQVYAITGLNHSIVIFNNYLIVDDLQGAQAYIFGGNDTFSGSGGDDVALGYGGNDSMAGMDGNDLSYGGSGNDTMIGGNGNDTADGGEGADSLVGGPGNDTSVIDASDTVVEGVDEGTDTILADFTYTLLANFENLTLTGSAGVNGTGNALGNVITGNAASNVLAGGGGADTLTGGDGMVADTLDGGGGNDVLQGGDGNDTYIVDAAGDVISDIGGFDTVMSGASYSLAGTGADVLTLTGGSAINGIGNEFGNLLNGNEAANVLDGGLGADTMAGGAGNDSYVVDNFSEVIVEGVSAGIDGVTTNVTFALPANVEHLTMTGAAEGSLTGNALDNSITGSSGANGINGGAGADTLSGGAGDDIYYSVEPADVVVENSSQGTDQIWVSSSFSLAGYANVENLRVESDVGTTLIGNALNNWLVSFGGDDYLDAGAGADSMSGNSGNDTYVIDSFGDVVYEYVGTGIDTVRTGLNGYTLGADLDVLVITGAGGLSGNGNALDNILSGNNGNDTLDGASGADIIAGGPGNDTYVIDHGGDQVMELGNSGVDLVRSSVSYNLMQSWHVENLKLSGSAVNGNGNWLDNVITGNVSLANQLYGDNGNDTLEGSAASNDQLYGGNGNDWLNAANGDDWMYGGQGDDTYVVNATTTDQVVEGAGEGIDQVLAWVSYVLAPEVENLTLLGIYATTGGGNASNNMITGNALVNQLSGQDGADTLDGGPGNDTLMGGNGDDRLLWDFYDPSIQGGTGVDTLSIDGSAWPLDLTAIVDTRFTDIEVIDMTGLYGNTVLLDASEVLAISSSTDTLMINGDAGDIVNAGSGWTDLGPSGGYYQYYQGGATLLVEQDITLSIS